MGECESDVSTFLISREVPTIVADSDGEVWILRHRLGIWQFRSSAVDLLSRLSWDICPWINLDVLRHRGLVVLRLLHWQRHQRLLRHGATSSPWTLSRKVGSRSTSFLIVVFWLIFRTEMSILCAKHRRGIVPEYVILKLSRPIWTEEKYGTKDPRMVAFAREAEDAANEAGH
ncbi:hypothetical protein K402DRAFT_397963 [Aulographum hederae CBS 113979]|uniref:Uncharacterized protein n=1 Tax=Aulographum hederae CBS 113979 TaxID=1176131 RepID=A0A6G1GMW4_9PEZI|nr:hypothetical protein K402DRAFT_397963 [Aulographum hederae CBS 113979]